MMYTNDFFLNNDFYDKFSNIFFYASMIIGLIFIISFVISNYRKVYNLSKLKNEKNYNKKILITSSIILIVFLLIAIFIDVEYYLANRSFGFNGENIKNVLSGVLLVMSFIIIISTIYLVIKIITDKKISKNILSFMQEYF